MAINCETHTFTNLQKKVFSPTNDIAKWEKSAAYQDILGFLTAMNESVKGKKLSLSLPLSDSVKNILDILNILSDWIDDIPPIDQPQRYGNKAYRDFYARLKEKGESMMKEHIDKSFHRAVSEITPYLIESFGNSTRIDYGTGHELAFVMFLCCLHKIGVLKKEDSTATVNSIFNTYLNLTRKLQTVYKMEPAGSQGVWSLDDFQFIPFYWGSSQLMMNPNISPDMFTNDKVIEEHHEDYLFLSSIKYILQVKTGPFAEHSNQLWNISAVQSWTKINQGLLKMYKAEILNKYPIIQHVLFGSVLSFNEAEVTHLFRAGDTILTKGSLGKMGDYYSRRSSGGPITVMPSPAAVTPPGTTVVTPENRKDPTSKDTSKCKNEFSEAASVDITSPNTASKPPT